MLWKSTVAGLFSNQQFCLLLISVLVYLPICVSVNVSNQLELRTALLDQSIQDILLTKDVVLTEGNWKTVAGLITRNVQLRGAPTVQGLTLLDFNYVAGKLRLAQGCTLTFNYLRLRGMQAVAIMTFDFLLYSPGAFLAHNNLVYHRDACLSTDTALPFLRNVTRPQGCPSGSQNLFAMNWCDPADNICYSNIDYQEDFCTMAFTANVTQSDGGPNDRGGYLMVFNDTLVPCREYTSAACVRTRGRNACLIEATARQRAEHERLLATKGYLDSSSSGNNNFLAIVLPVVLGGLLLLTVVGFVLWHCRHKRRRACSDPAGLTRYEDEGLLSKLAQATRVLDADGEIRQLPIITVDRMLGRGGYGTVYSGTLNGAPVAVKVIPHYSAVEDRVLREVKLIKGLQHRNMVQAIQYIVLEFENRQKVRSTCVGSSQPTNTATTGSGTPTKTAAPTSGKLRLAAQLEQGLQSSSGRPRDTSNSHASKADTFDQSLSSKNGLSPNMIDVITSTHGHPCETWLFQELCNGGALGQWLRSQKAAGKELSMACMMALACDMARGLTYLHQKKLVHGDLKLENVLVCITSGVAGSGKTADSEEGRGAATNTHLNLVAKLSDFGLTRSIHASHLSTGTTGTVTHVAPERLIDGKLGPASDVFALGLAFWELAMHGLRPYQGLAHAEIVYRVVHGGLRPTFPSSFHPAYAALAAECWKHDSTQRPTAAEVLRRMEALIAELPQWQAGAATTDAAAAGSAVAQARIGSVLPFVAQPATSLPPPHGLH